MEKKKKKVSVFFLNPKVEKQLYFMIGTEKAIVFLSHSHLINSLKGTSPVGKIELPKALNHLQPFLLPLILVLCGF